MGLTTGTGYCDPEDLNGIYGLENFTDDFYGTMLNGTTGTVLSTGTTKINDDILTSYRRINEYLDAIGRLHTIPIGTQADTGRYPEAVVVWNVKDVIYNKLRSRFAPQVEDALPGWIQQFGDDAESLRLDIISGNIVFRDEVSVSESGIQPPAVVTRNGNATFYNNYNRDIYTGGDFERTFVIEIDGTNSGNEIGKATFRWSYDGGVTWEDEDVDTGTAWVELTYNVQVRWEPSGTANEIELGDRWQFRCIPEDIPSYGESSQVRARNFYRG